MKNNMIKKISMTLLIVIVLIFTILDMSNERAIKTNSQLNNKKIGWGIKRNDNHDQPDVGEENKKVLEENNGICLGNKDKKVIYLTFDEGYEAGYTEKILTTLRENNVKATFFITAHYLNTQEELVKKMIDEGHILGNHTVNHKSMPDLTNEQIQKEVMDLHTAVYQKFNYEMKYIRPPKGEYSERTVAYTNTLGYKTVMWSFAYDDWDENKQGREDYGKKMVLNNIHPRSSYITTCNFKRQ